MEKPKLKGDPQTALFCDPPWWEIRGGKYQAGVRAGSRWPHTNAAISQPDQWHFQGDYVPYPFFMGSAVTWLGKHAPGIRSRFYPAIAMKDSYSTFFEKIAEMRPGWVIIETATPSWEHDLSIIRNLKQLVDCKVIITGTISVESAPQIMETGLVEAVVKGEYEKGVAKVIRGEATGIVDHEFLTEEDMENQPFPYWDNHLVPLFWDHNPPNTEGPQLQVWSSRGCSYRCHFCSWVSQMTNNDITGKGKRTWRPYSKDYMDAFLTDMVSRHQFRSVYFDDDTFNMEDDHVLGICEIMGRLGKPWSAMCRADTIERDTWKAIRDAGCYGVKVGIESGDQRVVSRIIKKGLNVEKARETVFYLRELGINVHGTFCLQDAYEGEREITARYITSTPFSSVQVSDLVDIEGTPYHEQKKREQAQQKT